MFITNNELQATVADALQVLRANNPTFKPRVAMVDYCGAEISAFQMTWPAEKAGNLNYGIYVK